ncbi:hypothetical protein Q7P37_001691 [Cladosporium fusiforme]
MDQVILPWRLRRESRLEGAVPQNAPKRRRNVFDTSDHEYIPSPGDLNSGANIPSINYSYFNTNDAGLLLSECARNSGRPKPNYKESSEQSSEGPSEDEFDESSYGSPSDFLSSSPPGSVSGSPPGDSPGLLSPPVVRSEAIVASSLIWVTQGEAAVESAKLELDRANHDLAIRKETLARHRAKADQDRKLHHDEEQIGAAAEALVKKMTELQKEQGKKHGEDDR